MMYETKEMLLEGNESRAPIYRMLARLYDQEVDSDLAALLARMEVSQETCASAAEQTMAAGMARMAASVANFDKGRADELACDFARTLLSIGADTGDPSIPYESVYTSENGLLMQEARDEVRKVFKEQGVMPRTKGDVPEDYLPYELEYMALLCDDFAEKIAEEDFASAASSLRNQAAFFHNHLLNWYGDLATAMRGVARTGFYRGLTYFTEGFFASEQDVIEDLGKLLDAQVPVPA